MRGLSLHKLIPGKFAYMQTCLFFLFRQIEFFEEKRDQVRSISTEIRSPVRPFLTDRIFETFYN